MVRLRCSRMAVSEIALPSPVWRYLLLFQTWSQFQSWCVIVAVATLFIQGLVFITNTAPLPTMGILVGAALGSLVSVFLVFPARFVVSPITEEVLGHITTSIEEVRYIQQSSEGDVAVFRQDLPRWLRWNEGDIAIVRENNEIVISGPLAILRNIRRSILNAQTDR